jgi:hypothetical protein
MFSLSALLKYLFVIKNVAAFVTANSSAAKIKSLYVFTGQTPQLSQFVIVFRRCWPLQAGG